MTLACHYDRVCWRKHYLIATSYFFLIDNQLWDEAKAGWKLISVLWDSILMQGQNFFQEGERDRDIKIFQVKLLVSQEQNQIAQKGIFKVMVKTILLIDS